MRRLQWLTAAVMPPPAPAGCSAPGAAAQSPLTTAAPVTAAAGGGVTVALLSHLGGAHVELYMDGLAAAPAVTRVVLADPDGNWEAVAREKLGAKLSAVYADPRPGRLGPLSALSVLLCK